LRARPNDLREAITKCGGRSEPSPRRHLFDGEHRRFEYNSGGDSSGFAAHFDLAGPHADILLRMLPPIVHIQDESGKATLADDAGTGAA
jgi:hypothetical protein